MSHFPQVDWEAVKLEYCKNLNLSMQELAQKFGVTYNALRGRIDRGDWAQARENYSTQYSERIQQLSIRSDAPQLLKALNEKTLKQSDELRIMLNMKLKMKDKDGKVIVRPDVTIIEVRCAVAAFAELYRMDRLALGASTDNISTASTQASHYDDMTEEQLMEELHQVRQRVTIQ